ncbi:PmoA family protein [Allomuricauda sp. CP2A]|jgi:hypothetical protein|uniref:DUF6807 domain-containing protein n=1 Tax=Allomuricauda sp. CP2A TaxID=1848189 RepID=UPI000836F12F|nr:PmoA family protein [Muricauda sp. CP2A]
MKYSLVYLSVLFILIASCDKSPYASRKEAERLVLSISDTDVLSYQFETMPPPEGVDSAFHRSGFIHPLKTLGGHTLTAIHPEDHYHHFGVWNPWTRVVFEGDTIDFWNLGDKKGTVRFKEFKEIGDNTFRTHHEHVVLKQEPEKIALNEVQTVTVTELDDKTYALDVDIEYQTTDSDFKLIEYRYGGFSIRATKEWTDATSEILTSEGITRENVDGSLAKWCLVQGKLGDGHGGFLLMSNPNNYNHPEPLRIWPKEMHDGYIFVNVCPIKTMDWLMKAGNSYNLQYRLVVFDGEMDAERAESLWNSYKNQKG